MDTNVAWPLGPDTCRVDFNYWLEPLKAQDADYISSCLDSSDQVILSSFPLSFTLVDCGPFPFTCLRYGFALLM